MSVRRSRAVRLGLESLEAREVPAAVTAPTVPPAFSAQAISGSQVKLTWGDTANEQGYRVYQWDGKAWNVAGSTAANVTNFVASNLTAGRAYYFYVAAFNAAGSAAANWVSVTTAAPPTAPGSVTTTALSGSQVRLNWADSTNEDGYRVFQWDGKVWNKVGTLGANATTFTASGLTAGQTYYFYVEAYNANGVTDSAQVLGKTASPPAAPGSFTVVAVGASQARLSWADVAGETGYHAEQWNGTVWKVIGSVAANATSFLASNLSPGQTYFFRVEAYNAAGASAANYQSLTLAVVAPTVPATFSAAQTSATQALLTWSDSAREDGYRVYEWNGTAWNVIAAPVANTTSYLASGLARGRTYYFRVEAFNAGAAVTTSWLSLTMA